MRIVKTLLLVLVLSSAQSMAQNKKFDKLKESGNYLPGTVVTNNGEKLDGLIRKRSEVQMHDRISFVDSEGNKSTFKPTDLLYYLFEEDKFRSDKKSNHFYRLLTRGVKISLYERRLKPSNKKEYGIEKDWVNSEYKLLEGTNFEDLGIFQFYYRESEDEFIQIPQEEEFMLVMKELFKDCSRLIRKLNRNEFGKNRVRDIMNFYNFQCK